jgi:hypothetical protein
VNRHGRPVATFSTLASSVPRVVDRPYRWRGTPGWDPAAAAAGRPAHKGFGGCTPEVRARSQQRQADFAKMRAAGVNVREAAVRLGVALSTAKNYERARRAASR